MHTVSQLPVPVELSLPDGWLTVPPQEVNAENAAFVAAHPETSRGFTATITITGHPRGVETSLWQVAEEALAELRAAAPDLRMGRRDEWTNSDLPTVTQAVRFSTPYRDKALHIVQTQAFIGVRDPRDAGRGAVVQLVLSALPEQFEKLIDEFQTFLTTVRPESTR